MTSAKAQQQARLAKLRPRPIRVYEPVANGVLLTGVRK